jgi:hypothetical protein
MCWPSFAERRRRSSFVVNTCPPSSQPAILAAWLGTALAMQPALVSAYCFHVQHQIHSKKLENH